MGIESASDFVISSDVVEESGRSAFSFSLFSFGALYSSEVSSVLAVSKGVAFSASEETTGVEVFSTEISELFSTLPSEAAPIINRTMISQKHHFL